METGDCGAAGCCPPDNDEFVPPPPPFSQRMGRGGGGAGLCCEHGFRAAGTASVLQARRVPVMLSNFSLSTSRWERRLNSAAGKQAEGMAWTSGGGADMLFVVDKFLV